MMEERPRSAPVRKAFIRINAILMVAFLFLLTRNSIKPQPHAHVQELEFKPMSIGLIDSSVKDSGMTDLSMAGVSIDDISSYNKWLSDERQNILLNTNFSASKITFSPMRDKKVTVIANEHDLDYFRVLSGNKKISTYALYINSQYNLEQTNIKWFKGKQTGRIAFPRDVMYPFGLEQKACEKLLPLKSLIGQSTCERRSDFKMALKPFTLNDTGLFSEEYESMLRWYERMYLHVIKDAHISNIGTILQDRFYVEPSACELIHFAPNLVNNSNTEVWKKTPHIIDEVFVSIKIWSRAYFHWNIEDISRIAIYVEFLQQYPNIKILIPEYSKFRSLAIRYLQLLGLDEKQFTWGPTAGKVVYLPQGSRCMTNVSTYGLRLAASAYANYVKTEMNLKQTQDTIVLIHRTRRRYLVQHDLVKDLLEQIAASYGLKFTVFSDTNLPSFNDTIKIFNRAAMVVAPHGAGLVNTMFSQPRTIVIEILCTNGNPMCYPYLSRNLGHIYYGMRHDKFKYPKKCTDIWVDIDKLHSIVNYYLSNIYHDNAREQ